MSCQYCGGDNCGSSAGGSEMCEDSASSVPYYQPRPVGEDAPEVNRFIEYLMTKSEFDKELIMRHVRTAAQMGKLKLP